ncbi:hypothetical protein C7437_102261 [Psychrobacillus insolitus]|uniref:Uncharacterized protein n=1 Tax=Psychrobacillus insolitus TaxID=1461 RepID=A0A2W7PDS4_9BACI|nr:hypothetical protein C7437_102261 [Psychrobacillus insolitus]
MPVLSITILEGRENELIELCMRDVAYTVRKYSYYS